MTQAPIEPRHKDEAAKAAEYEDWISVEVSNHPVAIAARASILAHAQTLANLEAAQADLAEIDRIAVAGGFAQCLPGDPCLEIAAIAAPYRAIDLVAEVLKDVLIALGVGPDECVASKWNAGVAKFRAFIEGDR